MIDKYIAEYVKEHPEDPTPKIWYKGQVEDTKFLRDIIKWHKRVNKWLASRLAKAEERLKTEPSLDIGRFEISRFDGKSLWIYDCDREDGAQFGESELEEHIAEFYEREF